MTKTSNVGWKLCFNFEISRCSESNAWAHFNICFCLSHQILFISSLYQTTTIEVKYLYVYGKNAKKQNYLTNKHFFSKCKNTQTLVYPSKEVIQVFVWLCTGTRILRITQGI